MNEETTKHNLHISISISLSGNLAPHQVQPGRGPLELPGLSHTPPQFAERSVDSQLAERAVIGGWAGVWGETLPSQRELGRRPGRSPAR